MSVSAVERTEAHAQLGDSSARPLRLVRRGHLNALKYCVQLFRFKMDNYTNSKTRRLESDEPSVIVLMYSYIKVDF